LATIQGLYFNEANKPSMEDVRVSPTLLPTRRSLPSEVLLIGAERDMFCREVEVMADKLAGHEAKVPRKEGWRAPGAHYHKVYGQPHGRGRLQQMKSSIPYRNG
jgi:acetyl esterase/lipase